MMRCGVIARKIGMSRIFNNNGEHIPVTILRLEDVEVLSVQFTKVGDKTYKAMPNLKWIIVRQHGYDNINLNECEQRSIGVATTSPFTQSTADWISDKINEDDKVVFIGHGSIARRVTAKNIDKIERNSTIESIEQKLSSSNCSLLAFNFLNS